MTVKRMLTAWGKLESIASLAISLLMLLSFFIIMGTAVWKFLHPVATSGFGVYLALGCNAVFAFINGNLFWRTSVMERSQHNQTLVAQRRLYTVKTLSNFLFVVAMALILLFAGQIWTNYIDPTVSVLLALIFLLNATKTLRSSSLNLLDRALEERQQLLILRALAEHYDRYTALQGIRTRHSGDMSYVEIFLSFEP